MADSIYTSQYGSSPQGQSTQNLSNALSKITGMPPQEASAVGQAATMQQQYPSYVRDVTASRQQAAGLPQMAGNYSDEAKLLAMFNADQNMAQKYTAPMTQPTDVPTYGRVGVPATPMLTQQSLNQGYQGFTTPGAVTSAMGIGSNQVSNALNLIGNAIQYQAGEVQKGVTSDAQAYQASIDALTNMATILNQQRQQTEPTISEKLSAAQSGYEWNPTTKQWVSIADEGSIELNDRKAVQEKYNSLPAGSAQATKIASQWKTSHGSPLFPDTMTEKERTDLEGTLDTYNRVVRVINAMDKYPDKFPQGLMGKAMEAYIQSGVAGTLGGLDPEIQQVIGDLMALRGLGDRALIGGRLTGYLLDRLGVAFPGAEKSIDVNRLHLEQLKSSLENDLKLFSKNKGYDSPDELTSEYSLDMTKPYSTVTAPSSGQSPVGNQVGKYNYSVSE